MGPRVVVALTALGLGLSLLGGCGRLGFDALIGENTEDSDPHADAGPDAGMHGGGSGTGQGGRGGSGAAGMDGGSRDGAVPPPANDGGTPPADAGSDGGAPPDAAADDDSGTTPNCPVSPVTDYCAALPLLSGTPVIDGELECGLVAQPLTPIGWTVTPAIPADHSARLAAAWLPAGLYVFLDVNDTSRLPAVPAMASWCGDAVELYADADGAVSAAPAYDDPGAAQLIARVPADDTQSVTSMGERYRMGLLLGPWSSTQYGAFPRPGGYVFEAFIAAADLDLASWTLQAGSAIGFDVSVNVSSTAEPAPAGESNDCGRRMGQYFLHIADAPCSGTCYPFQNAAAFCTPVLQN